MLERPSFVRPRFDLGILVFVFAFLMIGNACTPTGDPSIGAGFEDNFDRERLGDKWNNTGASWEIRDGQLHIRGARNKPLWLKRRLPRDVEIEFDVRSESDVGDIKVELFGDGESKATSESYTATSYVVIFGGWGNKLNIIARLDEHGSDRVIGKKKAVVKSKTYHFRIRRRGNKLSVWVDDEILVEMNDNEPLEGRGHDHFAFNNWQSDLWFDNLKITAL